MKVELQKGGAVVQGHMVMDFYCSSCNTVFPFKSKYERHLQSSKHRHFVIAREVVDTCSDTDDNDSIDDSISAESTPEPPHCVS